MNPIKILSAIFALCLSLLTLSCSDGKGEKQGDNEDVNKSELLQAMADSINAKCPDNYWKAKSCSYDGKRFVYRIDLPAEMLSPEQTKWLYSLHANDIHVEGKERLNELVKENCPLVFEFYDEKTQKLGYTVTIKPESIKKRMQ